MTKANGDAEKVKQGSYAFFQEIGATDAVDILNNKEGYTDSNDRPFNRYNDPTSTLDATSLENMKRALDMMDKCNELRRANGLSELKVTSALMAVAQTDANWSSYNRPNHAGADGNGYSRGENLAWGSSDPFKGWYDAEKAKYDSGDHVLTDVGHYLNIVNSRYTVTGYVYSRYGGTDAQQFDFNARLGSGKTYTVSEYRQLFESHYNKVTGGTSTEALKNALADAQKKKVSTESSIATYKNLVKTNEAAYKEAMNAAELLAPKGVAEAQKNLTAANDTLTAAQKSLGEAQSSKSAADAALMAASDKLADATSTQKEAQSSKSAADAKVSDAQKAVDAAQAALDAAKKGHPVDGADLEKALADAKAELNAATADAVAKNDAYTKVSDELSSAKQAVSDAQAAVTSAEQDKAGADVKAADTKVDMDAKKSALDKLVALNHELADALANLQKASDARSAAAYALDDANEALTGAQGAANTANADLAKVNDVKAFYAALDAEDIWTSGVPKSELDVYGLADFVATKKAAYEKALADAEAAKAELADAQAAAGTASDAYQKALKSYDDALSKLDAAKDEYAKARAAYIDATTANPGENEGTGEKKDDANGGSADYGVGGTKDTAENSGASNNGGAKQAGYKKQAAAGDKALPQTGDARLSDAALAAIAALGVAAFVGGSALRRREQ